MNKRYQHWLDILYGPIFKVIGFFYRAYTANRNWMQNLKDQKKISSFINAATVIILIIWILMWLFASEESRNALTEAVKEFYNGMTSTEK